MMWDIDYNCEMTNVRSMKILQLLDELCEMYE